MLPNGQGLIGATRGQVAALARRSGKAFPPLSSQYYSQRTAYAGSPTTLALVANRLYAMPFFLPDAWRFNRAAINVTALAAGSSIAISVFEADPITYLPGAPIVSIGSVSAATTGFKTIDGSWTLGGGEVPFVWVACESDGTATVSAISPTEDLLAMDGATPHGGRYVTHTYGTDLPTPFGAGTAMTSSPLLMLRKA